MEDRHTKMVTEMGEMLCIKGARTPTPPPKKKKEKKMRVWRSPKCIFIISIQPGPSNQMVLLSGKWVKRQNKKKKWRYSPAFLDEHTQRIMVKMCRAPTTTTP